MGHNGGRERAKDGLSAHHGLGIKKNPFDLFPPHNALLPCWLASARERMFLIVIAANWHLFPGE
jgi:hypothetical protein